MQAFTAELLDAGAEPATARSRQLSLKRFSAWLTEEGELDADPLLGLEPPKLDTKVTDALTDDELKAMIKACSGKSLRERRDEAIVRLMTETGMRAGEVVGMQLTDLDLSRGLATVTRGKGGKGRIVPFGSQTATALDRHIRTRRAHVRADSPDLWVGDRGKGFSYYGLHAALCHRARIAGIERWVRPASPPGLELVIETPDLVGRRQSGVVPQAARLWPPFASRRSCNA